MIRPETYYSRCATPELAESPLLNRIKMARTRARSFPVDSMDFIMIDLERPSTLKRHADFCTGDLTGRYLDFLTATIRIDPSDEARMRTLYDRIMKCQSPAGPFGLPYTFDMGVSEHDKLWGTSYRLFIGLLRYHALTGDPKALLAAERSVEYFFSRMDQVEAYLERVKRSGHADIFQWITEPMAALYGINGDKRCLDVCRRIAATLPENSDRSHTHGLMATLRGLQLMAIYSGDASFTEVPVKLMKQIKERAIWADGNVAEALPMSPRNEGCAIADWVTLNLYDGFITGSDASYDEAENTLYNALFLNQIVNGGFGTRQLDADRRGYEKGELSEECWWCCLHTGGVAMAEFAEHTVTVRGDELRVNLLLPGKYTVANNGRQASVEIITRYPEKADTLIFVKTDGTDLVPRIRIPKWIKSPKLEQEKLPDGTVRFRLSGKMGYETEEVRGGIILRYGPLVMVPLHYDSTSHDYINYDLTGVPKDYVPEKMPEGRPALVPVPKDEDGFLIYPREPRPLWQCYEEGITSRLTYEDLSINVPLYFADGKIRDQRFYPECYSTTAMIGSDLPLVFDKG